MGPSDISPVNAGVSTDVVFVHILFGYHVFDN